MFIITAKMPGLDAFSTSFFLKWSLQGIERCLHQQSYFLCLYWHTIWKPPSCHNYALSLLAFSPPWDFIWLNSQQILIIDSGGLDRPIWFQTPASISGAVFQTCTRQTHLCCVWPIDVRGVQHPPPWSWNSTKHASWLATPTPVSQVITCKPFWSSRLDMMDVITTEALKHREVKVVVTLEVQTGILHRRAAKRGLNSLYTLIERALLFHLNRVCFFCLCQWEDNDTGLSNGVLTGTSLFTC